MKAFNNLNENETLNHKITMTNCLGTRRGGKITMTNSFLVSPKKIKKMDNSLRLRLPKIPNYLQENDLLPPKFKNFSVVQIKNYVQNPVFIIQSYPLLREVFAPGH